MKGSVHVPTNYRIALQFPIKIVSCEIPIDDIRDELIRDVSSRCIKSSINQRSNIGSAWRSDTQLHTADVTSTIAKLLDRVIEFNKTCIDALHVKAKPIITECWLNELGPGAYNSPHDHFPAQWSGILWIDAEHETGDGPAGNLELMAPYPARVFGQQSGSIFVKPVNGMAMFFPSGLKHMVHPTTTGKRISLAWNCNVEAQ